jgi:hypothetical protein
MSSAILWVSCAIQRRLGGAEELQYCTAIAEYNPAANRGRCKKKDDPGLDHRTVRRLAKLL